MCHVYLPFLRKEMSNRVMFYEEEKRRPEERDGSTMQWHGMGWASVRVII